jgi:hypothetical protein
VKVLELGLAGLFALGGVRSFWKWGRRPFEGTDAADHALYALFVTGRVGLWLAMAGLFLLFASVEAHGRPALDELEPYRWYLLVPLLLAAMQAIGGWFLGRREPAGREAPADKQDVPPSRRL